MTISVAKAQASSVSTNVKKGFHAALTHLQGQLDIDTVRALGVGTLPKITADRAGFEMGEGSDKKEYGDYIDYQIISYNDRWLITAGVEGEDGKELLRTSYDGETLEGNPESVNEYLRHLKEEGYAKADKRHYLDAFGFVLNSKVGGEVSPDDRELIQLQLSPTSVKQFKAYQLQAGVRAATTGKEPSDVVRATIEKKEFNGNRYAQIKFSAVPA